VASDRLAGTLMSGGAALALIVMALSGFFAVFIYLFSFLAFGLVFLFGMYVARKRTEGSILAAATLWFVTIGGLPFLWISGLPGWFGWRAFLVGYMGLAGTTIAIAGAALKLAQQQGQAGRPSPKLFERASWLLGAGSFSFLLVAAMTYPGLSSPGYGEAVWRAVLFVVGVWLHLFAWVTLFAATSRRFEDRDGTSRLNRGRLAWIVSVLSFAAVVYLAPWFVPLSGQDIYSGLLPSVWLFPFHPAVFAPVVFCHASIFRGYSRFLPPGLPRKTVWIGVLALSAAAAVGLVGLFATAQVSLPPETFWWIVLPFPSSSTAIGYGLVFYGWRRGAHLEPAEPSDGPDLGRVVAR
jgi:hypothetical protein